MDQRGSAPGYMARTLSGAASIFFCKWEYVFCSANRANAFPLMENASFIIFPLLLDQKWNKNQGFAQLPTRPRSLR